MTTRPEHDAHIGHDYADPIIEDAADSGAAPFVAGMAAGGVLAAVLGALWVGTTLENIGAVLQIGYGVSLAGWSIYKLWREVTTHAAVGDSRAALVRRWAMLAGIAIGTGGVLAGSALIAAGIIGHCSTGPWNHTLTTDGWIIALTAGAAIAAITDPQALISPAPAHGQKRW